MAALNIALKDTITGIYSIHFNDIDIVGERGTLHPQVGLII